jgi:uncharacterized protein (UPF0332 family)
VTSRRDDAIAKGLARSQQELEAAKSLTRDDFPVQAVSRAYYAAFYSAEAALTSLDESRSKHTGVISAFVRLVVRSGGIDQGVGALLQLLFETRNKADYEFVDMERGEAEAAIADAERFVDTVEAWLGAKGSG